MFDTEVFSGAYILSTLQDAGRDSAEVSWHAWPSMSAQDMTEFRIPHQLLSDERELSL